MKKKIFSGVQPTGNLHLGNYLGAIKNFVALQKGNECVYCVVDLHAITVKQDPTILKSNSLETMAVFIAAGLNPEESIMFNQSSVSAHSEFAWILNCVSRIGWMNRMTQFKEKAGSNKENASVGLYVYPTLMASDILLYDTTHVPVGEDQVPHVELTREIGRRFNTVYKETFPEPQALLTQVPRLPGLDGRKMSKSYNNDISLSDSPEKIWKKIKGMITDPARKRRHDPGNPDVCPVYSYHKIYSSEETKQVVQRDCRTAKIGCIDCKNWVSKSLINDLTPLLDSRREYVSRKGDIQDIIKDGNNRASEVAKETMQEVRQAVKFSG